MVVAGDDYPKCWFGDKWARPTKADPQLAEQAEVHEQADACSGPSRARMRFVHCAEICSSTTVLGLEQFDDTRLARTVTKPKATTAATATITACDTYETASLVRLIPKTASRLAPDGKPRPIILTYGKHSTRPLGPFIPTPGLPRCSRLTGRL